MWEEMSQAFESKVWRKIFKLKAVRTKYPGLDNN
jgi:hypothetical protein